jgi:protein involved in polysaccharide export with SLBB domain/capsular polysaccharide biosynthesis protein
LLLRFASQFGRFKLNHVMKDTRSHSEDGAGGVPHYSSHRRSRHRNGHWRQPRPHVNGDVRPMLLDTWALAEAVFKRWYWILLGALICGGLGGFAGWTLWQPYYVGSSQLIRFEQQNSAEFFKNQEITQPTFVSILESPALIQRVSRKASPALTPDDLKNRLTIAPARDSDIVAISVVGETDDRAVALANLYATNAVDYFRDLQREDAAKDNEYLTNQLHEMDLEIAELNKKLKAAPLLDPKSVGPNPVADRLSKAQDELDALLSKFTEVHPDVIQKKRDVERLQAEVQKFIEKSQTEQKSPGKGLDEDQELLRQRVSMLVNGRILTHTRQREAEQFMKNPPGYCRIFAMAEPKDVLFVDPKMKIGFVAAVGGIAGIGGAVLLILLFELLDNRLKTVSDLKRVTRLPVIATLGDLERMHPSAQSNWAFRTWTALQSRLSLSPNHGLVCGFTSSGGGQGRSTWIRLLAKAASQCGFRVLTIATLPSPPFMQEDHQEQREENHDMTETETASPFGEEPSMAVANNVLSTPAEVTEKLTGENPQPLVHIPLPGWVWSLERRKQWQSALKQWRNIENIVILVELPPACDPESVLLAENIPNVIWLSDGSKADATESREQLQTLRDARCNLVGSVMNRAPGAARMKKRFSRWVGVWPLLACICLAAHTARAQTNDQATPASPASPAPVAVTNQPAFSATSINQRAEWQKRLTLGPGDVLNISMYGQPDLARLEVMIGPDGRLSYLQATEVTATGLTVDELRARLDEELGKFYRSPRTIVVPTIYKSKKYYVLGKVVNKGVYVLDRPVTVLEAVARAHGLETGLMDNQNTFDLADLQRSFIMRGNKRLEVNLESLFLQGDLTQNVALEPDDYLYFASANLKEVYVLGEVKVPGPVLYTPGLTLMGALSGRQGYTDKAFKSRVVVVRGSLNRPKTFVVDTWATLDARGLDFELQPKDIVYVHNRPFIRVEEVLDLAATAFIQSATASWANQFIGPIIKSPILPQP